MNKIMIRVDKLALRVRCGLFLRDVERGRREKNTNPGMTLWGKSFCHTVTGIPHAPSKFDFPSSTITTASKCMYRTCLGHVKGLHAFRQRPARFILTRNISWRSQSRSAETSEHFDKEQEIERSTILDKVMKGRQPTELMLRCTWPTCVRPSYAPDSRFRYRS